tara:strand:- start:9635 stop:11938 length:2304 start_codon:yes stop_codon:yes gene_type:complete
MASLAVDKNNGIMKINWTIHGGGSDGYYYNEGGLQAKKEMHEDFVKVKDLFEYINDQLPQEKKIKSLKIFRWTSPGASIVSNETIDDVFREIFEHPFWPQLYQGAWKTRSAMGKNFKHLESTVGSDEMDKRGPGELLKDLQLFMYDEANPQEASDIFLNELLSTEFINKYTQATSSDFGIWTLHDKGNYEDAYPEFEKRVKAKTRKEQTSKAQKLHEEIFKTKEGKAGNTPTIKMTEAIKDIIVTLAKNYSDGDFPQHWEFFPVTCSPMTGVEGRRTLIENRKFDKDRYKVHDGAFRHTGPPAKPPQLIRLHTNAGLTFGYMLNIAKRCKVFNDGKKRREKWVADFNEKANHTKWEDSIDKLNPHELIFYNTFDCMDPDERRQLYIDINMFLQNVRPNATRQQGNVFNAIAIDKPSQNNINLFDDTQFNAFIKTLEAGVKFDSRISGTGSSLVSKIEANSFAYINEIINEVDNVLLEKGMHEKTPENQSIDEAKYKELKESVPKILKLLFYVIYQASHHEDGIAKDYGLDVQYNFGKSSGSSTNYSMGDPGWGYIEDYNFGNAINKWVKSFWAGWSWRPRKMNSVGQQRMAKGVSDQLVSVLLNKGPLPSAGYDKWQDNAYEYLQYADGFIRDSYDKIKHDIVYFATDEVITGATEEEAKQKLKSKVMSFMPSDSSNDNNFDTFYKSVTGAKTIEFDATKGKFIKRKNGGRKRKKRTRRKRKIKLKWSRKCKKRNKKKIIRIKKIRNKTTRSYIKVKKRRKKTRGTR